MSSPATRAADGAKAKRRAGRPAPAAWAAGDDLADVLAEYLAQQGPGYKPVLDGRITVK